MDRNPAARRPAVDTQVLQTYIDGTKVFDRSRHKDWTYQAGGFALADPGRVPKAPAALTPPAAAKARVLKGRGEGESGGRHRGARRAGTGPPPARYGISDERRCTISSPR